MAQTSYDLTPPAPCGPTRSGKSSPFFEGAIYFLCYLNLYCWKWSKLNINKPHLTILINNMKILYICSFFIAIFDCLPKNTYLKWTLIRLCLFSQQADYLLNSIKIWDLMTKWQQISLEIDSEIKIFQANSNIDTAVTLIICNDKQDLYSQVSSICW